MEGDVRRSLEVRVALVLHGLSRPKAGGIAAYDFAAKTLKFPTFASETQAYPLLAALHLVYI
jgi:hypothetical protein